ncbi:MAG: hypothetical protein Q9201_001055 [Fulgogasparrea decipioides]
MSSPYPSPLKVGIFLPAEVQLLDVAPIDILGMLEESWLQASGVPENLVAQALKIEYYFINEDGKGPNQMTGGFRVEVTHSIATCPPLDVLLIGGPHPSYRPSPPVQRFLRTQYDHVRAFMTVCSGYVPALFSGILDGKTATAPRELLPLLREKAPGVQWVERRWVRDGKIWTSGAVANGQEMMVGFMREELGDRREVVETVLRMSDIAVRGEVY